MDIFNEFNFISFSIGVVITSFIIYFFLVLKKDNKNSIAKKNEDGITKNNESKKKTANKLLNLSQEVSFKSQDLIWLINDNNKKAENLVERFENIAESVENNAAGAEEISATIEELSSSSNVIKTEMEKLEKISQQLMSDSAKNQNWIEESNNTLLEIATNVKKSGDSIESVEDALENTNKLLGGIIDITDQINLLALNASIEAARAGDAGRGFNVVAGEIKSLSEETEQLTSEIREAINNINLEIKNTDQIIENGLDSIEGVEELASKSIDSFNLMNNNLHNVINSISKLSDSTESQASATEQTTQAVESMTQEFINISENVSEVDKNIKNQKNNSETLINYSNNLNTIAYELHKISVENKSDEMLIFGVNPFTKPEKIEELYIPIINKLCQKINKNAKTVIVSDYEELTYYIKNNLIDIGWFSPMAYVKAKKETNVIPMITPLINGKDSYRGYIFTRKNSKYNKLKDLRNSIFAFVDPLSTSGYVYPKQMLKEVGINVNTDLKETLFLGNHDNVIKAVLDNKVEVGATYNEAWDRAAQTLNLESLNILEKTAPIPKDVIAARSDLDQNILEETKNIFLKADREISEVLNQTNITGFTESEDKKFDIIRRYNN
ncbi:methyl-accepting chemotaxis protein [Halanaerobium saccharolyticum subsp. saccharolyticum DSM 6643]|uniref:Methyl-accepting chemotaxis protein n=1 Tax=Halanaerobium saccharolyticum subsp. saccharolyticum DSM 6643 TaxID=1293054 RepID=M5DZV6_9FIRM|nr:phosphate/phosphite/phosphonate ABC transporter substrate-binding protein [Halanaerobium saccharolyticum]CCU78822.1 methyl-accepting chemotaxis protein [Halanaerobium saccharolyticum subsp. saccharolyticum DSM 6643]